MKLNKLKDLIRKTIKEIKNIDKKPRVVCGGDEICAIGSTSLGVCSPGFTCMPEDANDLMNRYYCCRPQNSMGAFKLKR